MKKRGLHILLALAVLLCTASVAVQANEDDTRVYDYADLLTDEEEAELTEACLAVEDEIETELYILTTDDAEGKDTVAYADDFGDEHAFGYDEPYGNYMILCIDMDNRVAWLSTSGKATSYLTERRIDSLLDDLYGYLTSGDYYNTCTSYIESSVTYLSSEPAHTEAETDPNQYQDTMYVYDEEEQDASVLETVLFNLFIAMIIGGVSVLIMSFHSRTRVTASAGTYSKGGPQIHRREDNFIRRTTTSRRIDNDNGGGGSSHGGGGSHTSSSGHSHGGGGRSF